MQNNIKNHIPKSFNLTDILWFLKKLFWLVIIIFIIFNIALFYFLNWIIYFLAIIFWNIFLFWALIPVIIWVWKTFLIEKVVEVWEEIKENVVDYSKEKIVKVVKKENLD
jgi:hypothetical protein